MKWTYSFILPLAVLLLSSCTLLSQFDGGQVSVPLLTWEEKAHQVYENQYVLEDVEQEVFWWCDLKDDCQFVLGEKHYLLSPQGEGVHIVTGENADGTGEPRKVPYRKKDDLCLTEFSGYSCSPNYVLSIDKEPDDRLYPELWGLRSIDAPAAWDISTGSDVRIAVIDTGADLEHEDLKGNIERAYDATTDREGEASDGSGHGTHVSGTVCGVGDNGSGISGVSWRCRLLIAKFLGSDGSGSTADAIKAIDWSVRSGAQIINASWGGGGYSTPMYNAIQRAGDAGVLFVAAAGNEGVNNDTRPHYPSSYDLDNIIAVSATTEAGHRASFSNYGKRSVDVAAPGHRILSARSGGGYAEMSGTSMAAPHVAGTLGLLLSAYPDDGWRRNRDRLFSGVRANEKLSGVVALGGAISAGDSLRGGDAGQNPPCCKGKEVRKCKKNCAANFKCEYKRQRRCRMSCLKEWCDE